MRGKGAALTEGERRLLYMFVGAIPRAKWNLARLLFPGNILSRSPITCASSMQYSKYCCTRNRQLRVVVRCFGIFPSMSKLTFVHEKRNKVSMGSGLLRDIF